MVLLQNMNVSDDLKILVWRKGKVVPGYNADLYRQDACGAWIAWDKYGIHDNIYGWDIDHIYPKSLLESAQISEDLINHIDNLRPLQYKNNISKGNDYPSYTAIVTADGNKNVETESNLIVNEHTRNRLRELYNI